MVFIKVLWGVIAIIWTFANLLDMQVTDEASQMLVIIAITLLLSLGNNSTDGLLEQIQQHAKKLTEQSKHIADVLDRIEYQLESSAILNTVPPDDVNEVEQTRSVVFSEQDDSPKISDTHLCPKCNSPMKIRTATKGENQGKQFYVCSDYPNCKEVIPA